MYSMGIAEASLKVGATAFARTDRINPGHQPVISGTLCGILIAILRLAAVMYKLTSKALIAALILCSLLLIPSARSDNDQFPEGPGKATFIKVCSQCHALD